VVDLAGGFENQELTVRVVFNDGLQVSGFFFRPPEPPPYEAPGYVDTGSFSEVDVAVGEEPWELPGVLSVPTGDGPFPVVVLVHGSGPNDRDETLGGNRPFRDLAWGLASAGVAVLRYDKRTRVYGTSLPPEIGLEEEVIEDALSALAAVKKMKGTIGCVIRSAQLNRGKSPLFYHRSFMHLQASMKTKKLNSRRSLRRTLVRFLIPNLKPGVRIIATKRPLYTSSRGRLESTTSVGTRCFC